MVELRIGRRKMKFYSFTNLYKWLYERKKSLNKRLINTAVEDSLKLLESMPYESDFKNYYKNLFNSLKVTDESLVD